jgi:hypothetical protein
LLGWKLQKAGISAMPDPHMAGQMAEAEIMAAQDIVAVHGEELRAMLRQSGPASVAQVLGLATGTQSPEAFLDALCDEARVGRRFSPNPPPAAPQAPAMLDCETIAGMTYRVALPTSPQ